MVIRGLVLKRQDMERRPINPGLSPVNKPDSQYEMWWLRE